jgi:hypothetical protein
MHPAYIKLRIILILLVLSQYSCLAQKNAVKKPIAAPTATLNADSIYENSDDKIKITTKNGINFFIMVQRPKIQPYHYIGFCRLDKACSTNLYYFRRALIENMNVTRSPNLNPMMLHSMLTEDITNDGNPEIAIKEAISNSNIYDAIIYRYFKIDKSLNISYLYSIERVAWHPANKVFIKRIPKDGIVNIYVCETIDKPGELAGRYTLDFSKANPVTNLEVFQEKYRDQMITSSPEGKLSEPDK